MPEPSHERIMEYETKFNALVKGGGHMIDFIGLEQAYRDVVEYKKHYPKPS